MSEYLTQDEVAMRLTAIVTSEHFTSRCPDKEITPHEARKLALESARTAIDFVLSNPPEVGLEMDGTIIPLETDRE